MAKVPLRLYIHDIENLIDRGQTEEALAHCKHILQAYPKCIDVYRLLGKSYLESQRYSDASEILQRVLATIPDDFVSHVGMSIIREDEGNLDGAIWHMERAYESQPSNTAVQEELRRLYGRRDGIEPPRIRMTRGALVRMYAKGDLYQQAIGELHAALNEEPQRDDLQVLLAKMYTATGRRVEAIEICSKLIAKTPYCYEANRMLAELLPGTSRAEDVPIYQQRVITLDPYMAFAIEGTLVSEVPDNAVQVERLEWDSAPKETVQPAWASSLGVSFEDKEPQSHELPDWLASLSPYAPGSLAEPPPIFFPADGPEMPALFSDTPTQPADEPTAQSVNLQPFIDDGDGQIPEWMKESGWSPSAGSTDEDLPVTDAVEEMDELGEALPASEIPEWLRSMAPAEEPKATDELLASAETESLNGLDEILAASGLIRDSGETTKPPATVGLDDIPGWLTFEPDQPAEAVLPDQPADQIASIDTTPDWIKALKGLAPEEPKVAAAVDLGTEEAQQIPEAPASAKATIPILPDQPLPSETAGGAVTKGTFAWLEELASQHGAEAPTILTRPSDRVEKPPVWIHSGQEESLAWIDTELGSAGLIEETPTEQPGLLISSLSAISDEGNQQAVDSQAFDEEQISISSEPVEATTSQMASDQAPEQFPEWLLTLAGTLEVLGELEAPTLERTSPTDAADLPGAPEEDGAEPSTALAELQSLDAVSSWTDLQAKPDGPGEEAKPGQPIFTPEASSAWVSEINETLSALEAQAGMDLASSGTTPTDEPAFELPDWLKTMDADQPLIEDTLTKEEGPAEIGIDLSAWISEEPQAVEAISEKGEPLAESPEMAAGEPSGEFDLPVDLDAFDLTGRAVQPEEEFPGWLDNLQEKIEEPQPEIQADQETTAESAVEISDWLQGLTSPEPSLEPAEMIAEEISAPVESGELLDYLAEPEMVEIPTEEIPGTPVADVETAAVLTSGVETSDWLAGLELAEAVAAPAEVLPVTEPEVLDQPEASLLETEPELPAQPEEFEVEPESELPFAEIEGILSEVTTEEAPSAEVAAPEPIAEQPAGDEQPAPEAAETPVTEPVSEEETLYNRLYAAQTSLYGGQVGTALEFYEEVIRSGNLLDESIHDLRDALYRYPVDISVWQLLGDAYVRSNRLQEALDAYTKAEELIR